MALVAGGVLLAGVGSAVGLGGGHRVEQRETLTHAVTSLSVDTGAGDVTVRSGAPAGTVQVTRRGHTGRSSPTMGSETWQETTLTIRSDCPGGCDVDYEIAVPDGVAVSAHTGSGDIDLRGTLGTLSLQAGSGDVKADVASSSLTTRTGSGDTDLRFRSTPSQLSATSGSGDVEVSVPQGQYAVQTQTGSGDTEVGVQRQDGSANRLQVRTGSGDITIRPR